MEQMLMVKALDETGGAFSCFVLSTYPLCHLDARERSHAGQTVIPRKEKFHPLRCMSAARSMSGSLRRRHETWRPRCSRAVSEGSLLPPQRHPDRDPAAAPAAVRHPAAVEEQKYGIDPA